MPEDRPRPAPGSAEESLRRLEQRLDRASEAAERLMAQAARAAVGGTPSAGEPSASAGEPSASAGEPSASAGEPSASAGEPSASAGEPSASAGDPGKPPPSGWQIREEPGATFQDPDPFVALAQALRDLIPPDLQRRLVAAIRELLLALRALIDWYLERVEHRREQAVEVQDIPIL